MGRRGQAEHARARCPDLDALTDLAHGFNQLVRQRAGHRLEEWINQAAEGPCPEVRGFATGLLSDFDARPQRPHPNLALSLQQRTNKRLHIRIHFSLEALPPWPIGGRPGLGAERRDGVRRLGSHCRLPRSWDHRFATSLGPARARVAGRVVMVAYRLAVVNFRVGLRVGFWR
ncbi:MAG: hypothetical protein ACRDT4_03150, partial [Micromonosporaceae bacterium]